MLKVLEAVQAKFLRREVRYDPLINVSLHVEPEYKPYPNHNEVYRVGIELGVNYVKPPEMSKDEMVRRVQRLVAHGIYGEVVDDLYKLMTEALDRNDTEAVESLYKLIDKYRGPV